MKSIVALNARLSETIVRIMGSTRQCRHNRWTMDGWKKTRVSDYVLRQACGMTDTIDFRVRANRYALADIYKYQFSHEPQYTRA